MCGGGKGEVEYTMKYDIIFTNKRKQKALVLPLIRKLHRFFIHFLCNPNYEGQYKMPLKTSSPIGAWK